MLTLIQILADNPTLSDADALALHLAQPVERKQTPIQVVRSYLSDEMLMTPIKAVRDNPVTPPLVRYGLAEFVDGLQNALTFNGLNDKVYALATQLVPMLASQIRDDAGKPILTAAQADTMLGFVRDVPTGALADVADARASLAKQALQTRWATVHNAIVAGIDDGTLVDWAAINAALPGLLAGGEG
jgi:hypothetical protein